MAKKKRFYFADKTGIIIYSLIRREADRYYFDNNDGSFSSDIPENLPELTESSDILGLYEFEEDREVWVNGSYLVLFYRQEGIVQNIQTDSVIGTTKIDIYDDEETTVSKLMEKFLLSGQEIVTKTYTVLVDGQPESDVLVIATTDPERKNLVCSGRTNSLGEVQLDFNLPEETTVYLWCYKSGVEFTNPDVEEI